jgi:hypothetical protein
METRVAILLALIPTSPFCIAMLIGAVEPFGYVKITLIVLGIFAFTFGLAKLVQYPKDNSRITRI